MSTQGRQENQVLNVRYIDKGVLSRMLTSLFGTSWEVEVGLRGSVNHSMKT